MVIHWVFAAEKMLRPQRERWWSINWAIRRAEERRMAVARLDVFELMGDSPASASASFVREKPCRVMRMLW